MIEVAYWGGRNRICERGGSQSGVRRILEEQSRSGVRKRRSHALAVIEQESVAHAAGGTAAAAHVQGLPRAARTESDARTEIKLETPNETRKNATVPRLIRTRKRKQRRKQDTSYVVDGAAAETANLLGDEVRTAPVEEGDEHLLEGDVHAGGGGGGLEAKEPLDAVHAEIIDKKPMPRTRESVLL